MPTWPAKTNYATGDVLTAAQMQDIGNALNSLESAQYAAGKNKIINGDFNINQRNFTSNTANGSFNFDRWFQSHSGGSFTVTTQTFTLGAAPVAGYEGKNFLQGVVASQSSASDYAWFGQKIESVRTLAGQTATISFWAKANSGTPKIALELSQYFGAAGSPSATVNTYAGQVTLSTSWARYSATVAVPSISGKTISTDGLDQLRLNIMLSAGTDYNARSGSLGVQNNTFQIWGVQVEAGNTATAFQTATGTLGGELAACQRYYFRATFDAAGLRYGNGFATSTTNFRAVFPYPVTMRTKPSALEQSGSAGDYSVDVGGTVTSCNAVPTFFNSTLFNGTVDLSVASGLTAGYAGTTRNVNTSAHFGWSAEL